MKVNMVHEIEGLSCCRFTPASYRVHAKLTDGRVGITPWYTIDVIAQVKADVIRSGATVIKIENNMPEGYYDNY